MESVTLGQIQRHCTMQRDRHRWRTVTTVSGNMDTCMSTPWVSLDYSIAKIKLKRIRTYILMNFALYK